jgi:phosphatidylinositol alpha-1,6-mannosyltransferase
MKTNGRRKLHLITCEYLPFPGGIATYAAGVAQAMRNEGYSVSVVAPNYPDAPNVTDPDASRILGHHKIGGLAALKVLRHLARNSSDDIILAADIRSVLFLYATRFLHRRTYRSMVHGSEVAKFRSNSLLSSFVKRAYLFSDLVLYNSKATRDIFVEAFGTPKRDAVSYLGVEPQWFDIVEGTFIDERLRSIASTTAVICSVGRIEARKGHLETVRALAKARDEYGLLDMLYVVAGRPEDLDYTEKVIAESARLGVPLLMTGRLDNVDLKRLYRRASAHVLFAQAISGKIEGFGLVLLEAAAQSCPTIASLVGGIPEVLEDSGTLVEPHDLDGLAREIVGHVSQPQMRERLGASARERAKGFTWLACASRTFPELFDDRVQELQRENAAR